jgi:replication initiation protein RepC
MKDSPNGKRPGRRHEKTGHIIEAYGVDLSPLAACHAEFLRLAEEGRAERAVMGRLRRARDDRQKGHYPDPRDRAGIRF